MRYARAPGYERRTYGAVPACDEEKGATVLPDQEGSSWLRRWPCPGYSAEDPQAVPGIAGWQREGKPRQDLVVICANGEPFLVRRVGFWREW